MEYIICHYKEILALIGSLTGFFALFVTSYFKREDFKLKNRELDLKDKEFSQRVTIEKEKELYGKEIETYQELYALSLKYYEQNPRIGLMLYDKYQQYEEEHNVYIGIVKEIFDSIKENIFYISKELDDKYQVLYIRYIESFQGYSAFLERNEDNYDEKIREQSSSIYSSLEKKFYEEHNKEIKELLDLIKKEFKEKRNYKETK